jgi:hypothetical protein
MSCGLTGPLLIVAVCLFSLSPSVAVESQPVKVLRIDSGLRLTVEGSLGGVAVPMAIQIEHLALLGDPQFSKQTLEDLCPVGSQVILRGPGPGLTSDAFGIIHALVLRDFDKAPNPTEARNGPFQAGGVRCCVQVELVRAGWAVLVKDERGVPPELHPQFLQAEREAKARKLGFYSLPEAASAESVPSAIPVVPIAPRPAPVPERPAEVKPNPF